MAYNESMKYLVVDTTKNKNVQREDKIHGGLLLLNELLRVSDVKFEVGNLYSSFFSERNYF